MIHVSERVGNIYIIDGVEHMFIVVDATTFLKQCSLLNMETGVAIMPCSFDMISEIVKDITPGEKVMKKYEVWMEGYSVQGNDAGAELISVVTADTFKEACTLAWTDNDGNVKSSFDPERLTFWGCRLFDNENEARKNFG